MEVTVKKIFSKPFLIFVFISVCTCFFAEELRIGSMPASEFPASLPERIVNNIANSKEFWIELETLLKKNGKEIFVLVDKKHPLPAGFIPENLVKLKTKASYVLNKDGLFLTAETEKALEKMAQAAKKDGVTILVSSAYRSFEYQRKLFERYSRQYGEKKTETFSAKPEYTQHRLGTVVDFGSISDEYAATEAGKWLLKNAGRYGWSLSYPDGCEKITGYKPECWHYRYLGEDGCVFQQKWFNNIQQYMLEFIDAYIKKTNDKP